MQSHIDVWDGSEDLEAARVLARKYFLLSSRIRFFAFGRLFASLFFLLFIFFLFLFFFRRSWRGVCDRRRP